MASLLLEPPQTEAAVLRQARIIEGTDARCLAQMLVYFRQTYLLAPFGVIVMYLAVREGASSWGILWFTCWGLTQVGVYWFAGRLQSQPAVSATVSVGKATQLFLLAGLLTAAVFPVFIIRSSEITMLLLTFIASMTAGATVISASGVVRAYVAYAAPVTVVLTIGWLWRGGVVGYVLALLFVVSFPRTLAAVRLHRRTVEDLVRLLHENESLAAALVHERDRANAASAAKTRFFAAASHDLRQPLHALSINATTLDLVARRSGDALLNDISQGIGSALRQGSRLLDGLLDVSRLDAHAVKMHVVPHDLGILLTAVRDEYAALAAERELALELVLDETPPWALTDADQLMRILGNLVDNALKFTGHGKVQLSARRESDLVVLVSVSDTGSGISAADRERVFDEFYQVGNPSRDRSKGLGLGLAIVRRTAALLDMPLALVSEVGVGTTFELRMPLAAACPAPLMVRVDDATANAPLSILVVDDEADVLASLCLYLAQIGWSARGVSSGEEAEQLVTAGFRPDVVVVDFRLRAETGLQVIERLRAHIDGLPAVVVTGDTSPSRLHELKGQSSIVLNKPVDGVRLAQALASAAGR